MAVSSTPATSSVNAITGPTVTSTPPAEAPVTPQKTAAAAKQVEQYLAKAGFATGGKPDEKLDPKSVESLKKFQSATGLKPTGVIDEPTVKQLRDTVDRIKASQKADK